MIDAAVNVSVDTVKSDVNFGIVMEYFKCL